MSIFVKDGWKIISHNLFISTINISKISIFRIISIFVQEKNKVRAALLSELFWIELINIIPDVQ